eukprot:3563470-Rhodomonas_salina.1
MDAFDLVVEDDTSESARWLMYFLSRTLTKEMVKCFKAKLSNPTSSMHQLIHSVCTLGRNDFDPNTNRATALDALYASLLCMNLKHRIAIKAVVNNQSLQEIECIFHALLQNEPESFKTRVTDAEDIDKFNFDEDEKFTENSKKVNKPSGDVDGSCFDIF